MAEKPPVMATPRITEMWNDWKSEINQSFYHNICKAQRDDDAVYYNNIIAEKDNRIKELEEKLGVKC